MIKGPGKRSLLELLFLIVLGAVPNKLFWTLVSLNPTLSIIQCGRRYRETNYYHIREKLKVTSEKDRGPKGRPYQHRIFCMRVKIYTREGSTHGPGPSTGVEDNFSRKKGSSNFFLHKMRGRIFFKNQAISYLKNFPEVKKFMVDNINFGKKNQTLDINSELVYPDKKMEPMINKRWSFFRMKRGV